MCVCVCTYLYDTSMTIICGSSIGKCEFWHLHPISLANLDKTDEPTDTVKKELSAISSSSNCTCTFFFGFAFALARGIYFYLRARSRSLTHAHPHTQLGQLHLALLAASNQVQGRVHAQRGGRGGGHCDSRCNCNQSGQLRLVGPQVKSSRVSTLLAASTN